MAVLTALAYPELYAALAVHSGIQYRAAASPVEALAAMQNGGPPPAEQARLAWEAMGEHARSLPVLLVQGAADPSVAPVNLDRLVALFAALHERAGRGPLTEASDRREQGRYALRRRVFRGGGGGIEIEALLVEGLAHAWSGGSAAGTWTDPAAPAVTPRLLEFFLQHPRTLR